MLDSHKYEFFIPANQISQMPFPALSTYFLCVPLSLEYLSWLLLSPCPTIFCLCDCLPTSLEPLKGQGQSWLSLYPNPQHWVKDIIPAH